MNKTRLVLSLALGLVSASLFGQGNTFPPSGNVGIGTVSPLAPIHILSNISDRRLRIGSVDKNMWQGETLDTFHWEV